jgi:hypothetical protein
VAPDDIWNYPARTLTEKFTIIERAKGYTSGGSKVLDDTRLFNGVIVIRGSGYGCIAKYYDDDVVPSKTFTAITTPSGGTFPSDLIDHNDSTGCQWSISSTTTDLFRVDFGSSVTGFLRVVATGTSSGATLIVYGSNDGTTWTQIASVTHGLSVVDIAVFVGGYRYVKISEYAGASYTATIYTVEFYPAGPLPVSRSFSNLAGRVLVYVNGYYQVLEVISV